MIAVRLPAAMASRTSGQVRSSIQTDDVWPCAGSATSSIARRKNSRFMNASWLGSVSYEGAASAKISAALASLPFWGGRFARLSRQRRELRNVVFFGRDGLGGDQRHRHHVVVAHGRDEIDQTLF